ncbi:hypothetical protein D3C80_2237160 [compost metagenome]
MNVQVCVHGNPDRRNIRRCMPGNTNPEGLTEGAQLERWGNATDLGDVTADIINLSIRNQAPPL